MNIRKQLVDVGSSTLALALGLALAAVVMTPGRVEASSSPSRSYTYVATGFYVVGPDYAATILSRFVPGVDIAPIGRLPDENGVHTAPIGRVEFVAPDNQFTFRATDRNPLADVAVSISWDKGGTSVCAPRGKTVTVSGVPAGSAVTLHIWDAFIGFPWCRSNHASTGTLTITP